ncbi:MAG: hypothetical protein ACRDKL_10465 [Solirubrobacteraceae bacterium]
MSNPGPPARPRQPQLKQTWRSADDDLLATRLDDELVTDRNARLITPDHTF